MLVLRGCTEIKIVRKHLNSLLVFFLFLVLPPSLIKIARESIVGMLEILTLLLWGLRFSRCLCSHETWDSCGLPAAQQVSWDSSFCQELEADGCQHIMSEVTQTTRGFSLAQVLLPQPETHCRVMLGRVQGPLLLWMGGTPAPLMS